MKTSGVKFLHEWSPRKEAMMQRDILVFLRRMGAKNPTWVSGEEDEEPPAPLYLHLRCSECSEDWYADKFEACRKCGSRSTVAKVEAQRVPLPSLAPGGEQEN